MILEDQFKRTALKIFISYCSVAQQYFIFPIVMQSQVSGFRYTFGSAVFTMRRQLTISDALDVHLASCRVVGVRPTATKIDSVAEISSGGQDKHR